MNMRLSKREDILTVAEENARYAAQAHSASLQRTQNTVDVQNALLVIVSAAWGAMFDHLLPFDKVEDHLFVLVIWIILGCAFLVLIWRLLTNTRTVRSEVALSAPDVHQQLIDLKAENGRLEGVGSKLEAWLLFQHDFEREVYRFERGVTEKLRAMSNQTLDPNDTEKEVRQTFEDVLHSLVIRLEQGRGELLGYTDNEVYFFDIFELNERDNRLHKIARACSPEAKQHARTWAISEGDVGDCVFKQHAVHVDYRQTPRDPTDPNYRESDVANFGCRISTPIFAVDNRPHSAYGALCITSSDPSRLTRDDVVFFENLAQPCASLFQRRRLAIRSIRRYRQGLERNEIKRVTSLEHQVPPQTMGNGGSLGNQLELPPSH
jgi:hypothetical protein